MINGTCTLQGVEATATSDVTVSVQLEEDVTARDQQESLTEEIQENAGYQLTSVTETELMRN